MARKVISLNRRRRRSQWAHDAMSLLCALAVLWVLASLLLSCETAGYVTGGDYVHEECLPLAKKELADTIIAENVCREISELPQVDRCDAETVGGEILKKVCFRWTVIDGVEQLCYRARANPE